MSTLQRKVFNQRRERADYVYNFAEAHGLDTANGKRLYQEYVFWLRAAMQAKSGDLTPVHFN